MYTLVYVEVSTQGMEVCTCVNTVIYAVHRQVCVGIVYYIVLQYAAVFSRVS